MIITAEDLWNDPLTLACVPMAQDIAGEPIEQYTPGRTIFRGHKKVLFLGHGHPGGELVKVDANNLIADLTDDERGLSPDSEVLLWSCFAAAGRTEDDNLVSHLADGLSTKKITGVRISGVPGALYTDTRNGRLYSGPPMKTKDEVTSVIEAIRAAEGHAWAESGLMTAKMKKKWDSALGTQVETGPDLKQVKVTIGEETFDEGLKQIVLPPNSVDVAVFNLIKSGKLPREHNTNDRKASIDAIANGVQEWYEIFFTHRIIAACLHEGIIQPWESAHMQRTT